jgi:hypothetical protein
MTAELLKIIGAEYIMDDFINLALIFWFLCEIIYFQLLYFYLFIMY